MTPATVPCPAPDCGQQIIPAYSGPSGTALLLDPQLQQGGYALQPSGSAYLTHAVGRAVHLEHDGGIQVVVFIRKDTLTVAPVGPVRSRVERILKGRLSGPVGALPRIETLLRGARLIVHTHQTHPANTTTGG